VARLRRNQRRVQLGRVVIFLRNAGLAAAFAVVAILVWRHVQSSRFAVQTIEVQGAVHTPRAAIDAVSQQYVGLNLFQIDIARVQRDLGGLPWVSRIDIEKKLPDTLRIKIAERSPVALVRDGDRLLYVDDHGVGFAELSPSVGDDDLPLVSEAHGEELVRSVALLRTLRTTDPQIYARISEIRPIPPRGFALFDRNLNAFVYANAEDASAKWRSLYAVLEAEHGPKIQYADLRFADRLVIKPVSQTAPQTATEQGVPHDQN
jgi:cell division protein FtsQ